METTMAHPYHHSLSSVKKWGGVVADYLHIHDWFDESKKIIADFRHRALRHHAEGIFIAETVFGSTEPWVHDEAVGRYREIVTAFGFSDARRGVVIVPIPAYLAPKSLGDDPRAGRAVARLMFAAGKKPLAAGKTAEPPLAGVPVHASRLHKSK
jgi:hypothetical protein